MSEKNTVSLTKGFVHKFADDINTDYIISSRYKRDTTDCNILKKYIFADIRDDFYGKIQTGDILICGSNFGCGSAMEVAAMVLRAAGFSIIIAKSFARSFYRNAMNNGIILIEADSDIFSEGIEVEVMLEEDGLLKAQIGTSQESVLLGKLSHINKALYDEGGLINYVNKYGRLPVYS